MRIVRPLLLAGLAVAGLGFAAPTLARELTHHMTVQLPGGGVETIEYSGNIAPRVVMNQAPARWEPFSIAWPVFPSIGPSFIAMDRIMADMDRQMGAMMHQAEMMTRAAQAPALNQALLHSLPAGTTSFSVIQTSTGNGVCTRVTRITRGPQDAQPQMVSETSGCGDRAQASPANPDVKHIDYRAPAVPTPRTSL
jgi:hypothetical protein